MTWPLGSVWPTLSSWDHISVLVHLCLQSCKNSGEQPNLAILPWSMRQKTKGLLLDCHSVLVHLWLQSCNNSGVHRNFQSSHEAWNRRQRITTELSVIRFILTDHRSVCSIQRQTAKGYQKFSIDLCRDDHYLLFSFLWNCLLTIRLVSALKHCPSTPSDPQRETWPNLACTFIPDGGGISYAIATWYLQAFDREGRMKFHLRVNWLQTPF